MGSGTLQLKLSSTSAITDLAGNAITGSVPVNGSTYTIDRLGPPVAFVTKPPDPNTVSTSTFSWTSQPAASDFDRFECSAENGPFGTQVPSEGGAAQPCASPLTYVVATTNNGQHQFAVRAYDQLGNFTEVTYSWKVEAGSIQDFTMSGNLAGGDLLYPGGPTHSIPVTFHNPNGIAITVTAFTVAVDAATLPAGCSASWFPVVQSNIAASAGVSVPANGSVTLPAQGVAAPTVRMIDSGNQDACRNATFTLNYTNGSAPLMSAVRHAIRRRRSRVALVALVAVAVAASGAFAYFSTTGTGSAQAGTGSLDAPAPPAAVAAATGSVDVSWSRAFLSGTSNPAEQYVVRRYSGGPSFTTFDGYACGTGSTAIADNAGGSSGTFSCTDSAITTAGPYKYSVTSVFRSWTSESALSSQVTVSIVGPLDHFALTATTTTPTAGQANDLTITAKDASNNTISTYVGDKILMFSGASSVGASTPTVTDKNGIAVSFGTPETITFGSGVATPSSGANGVIGSTRPRPRRSS